MNVALRPPHRRIGAIVGQRQQDFDKRDAVANSVMDPHHDSSAALVVLDNMEFPKRVRAVERSPREFGYEALQLGFAGPARKARPLDVVRDVEMRIVTPVKAVRPSLDSLAEAAVSKNSIGERRFQPFDVHRPGEDQHADNDHQVGWPIHAQPRDVHRVHTFAVRHRLCSKSPRSDLS